MKLTATASPRLHAPPHTPPRRLCWQMLIAALAMGATLAQAGPAWPASQPLAQAATTPLMAAAHGSNAALATHSGGRNLDGRMLYQVLLAEIAGRRGEVLLASNLYAELARNTLDPQILRRATEIALYARQSRQALELGQLWVQQAPNSPQAHQILAGILLSLQQPEAATSQLASYLRLSLAQPALAAASPSTEDDEDEDEDEVAAAAATRPNTELPADERRLLLHLEQMHRQLQRYPDKAVVRRMIDELTQPYQTTAPALYVRAQAALGVRDESASLAAIDAALTARPAWQQAVLFKAQLQQRSSSTLAESTLAEYLQRYPRADEVRLAYARSLIAAKQYAPARAQFETLLTHAPQRDEVRYALALLSMQLGEPQQAEPELKLLLEQGYGNAAQLRYFLGQIAEFDERSAEALQWYRAVSPGEHFLPAHTRAAQMLLRQGRLADAQQLLRAAAQQYPEAEVQLWIAEAQLLLASQQVKAAHELLEGYLLAQPEQPELLYETALLAERAGKLELMERHLRRLIKLKPDDAHAYNALGYALADQNLRLDEAAQLLDKALSLAPEDAYILDSKGWLRYRQGDHAAALELLSKAYELRADAEIAAHLGEVLWRSGRQAEAQKTWQTALEAHPGNSALQNTMQRFLSPRDAPPAQP